METVRFDLVHQTYCQHVVYSNRYYSTTTLIGTTLLLSIRVDKDDTKKKQTIKRFGEREYDRILWKASLLARLNCINIFH